MSVPEPITFLLLLGAAQGIVLGLLLLTRGTNVLPNRFLAASILGFAILMFEAVYYARGWYESVPQLIGVFQPVTFFYGPLLYFYARCLSEGGGWIDRRQLLHFVPAAAVALYLIPFEIEPDAAKIEVVHSIVAGNAPLDVEVIEALKFPHGLIYSVVTLVYLRRRRTQLEQSHSNLDRINLRWLQILMTTALGVWILATVAFAGSLLNVGLSRGTLGPAPLATILIVYGIGYMALRQPEILGHTTIVGEEGEGQGDAMPTGQDATGDGAGTRPRVSGAGGPSLPPASDSRYAKSGLSVEKADELHRSLLALMSEERPYLRPELTLHELATLLSVSPHNLSEVINSRLGLSFYDFVNGYRVEEVKRRLVDPRLAHQTVLAIALDAGFGSKSTFNDIFKRQTGLTPSRYRDQQLGSS